MRDEIVLSTKTFAPMDEGEDHGLAPARVRRQLESSLRRLGVERVQMYLTHAPDPDVPVAETLGVLDELQREGKLGAYGASNVDAAQLREALAVELPTGYGWVQNSYSLLDREAEHELLPLCAEHGLGFTPFSPLAGGWLTGKYRRNEPPPAGSRMTMRPEPYEHLQTDAVFDLLEDLERQATEQGTTMAALALAWLLANPAVTARHRRPSHAGSTRSRRSLRSSSSRRRTVGAWTPARAHRSSSRSVMRAPSITPGSRRSRTRAFPASR